MTLITSPAATTPTGLTPTGLEALAPLRLPPDRRLTPEQLELVCAENREAVLELAADGRVIALTPSDEGPRGVSAWRAKMAAYQANGARLGWLLLPHEQAVEAWPSSGPPRRLEQLQVLEGTPEFPGLGLQLAAIWEG
jgi:Uma2 family endonuclease